MDEGDAAKMNSAVTTTSSGESADDILGQFYFAYGQGVRARYFGPIKTAPGPWKAAAPNVLAFVAQVGRLCTLLATQAGRTAITAHEVRRACSIVEANVHRNADLQRVLILGPHCSGETVGEEEATGGEEEFHSVPFQDEQDHRLTHLQMRTGLV
jgi:hypothetical protein